MESQLKAARVQSPSSINTYMHCPRKYFCQYILKLPSRPNIHLIRGSLVHKVLEDFFTIRPSALEGDPAAFLRDWISQRFSDLWIGSLDELNTLSVPDLGGYFDESVVMLSNFTEGFLAKLDAEVARGLSVQQGFIKLRPTTEHQIVSKSLMVRGFIDAIDTFQGKVRLLDYKTSNSDEISDDYRRQLAIYAFLYEEEYGRPPGFVGVHFLKFQEKNMPVDQDLIQYGVQQVKYVHSQTLSTRIDEYPMNPGPLCKWRTGQCDFYERCFPAKGHSDFVELKMEK
ncbi:MAG: PD-(D/E)XK nuclease family protein [Nanoarchaeota archaeon]